MFCGKRYEEGLDARWSETLISALHQPAFRRLSRSPHSTRRRRLALVFLNGSLIVTVLFFFGLVSLPDDETCLVSSPACGIVARILDALVIYMSCNETTPFPVWKSPLPTFNLSCSPKTNEIDCHEAVPMLTFFIEHYDRPLARKYIFIHAHETSWHYRRLVFDQIREIVATDYFKQNSFGDVFPVHCRGKGRIMTESMYRYVYRNTSMPPHTIQTHNHRPCCATFFVDSSLVHTRSKHEYRTIRSRLRQWSRDHPILYRRVGNRTRRVHPAFYCGRTMEYTWHLLLANRTHIPSLPSDAV
jgi:hypothetical protein